MLALQTDPALSVLERRVVDAIARRHDDLTALVAKLVGFDTRVPEADWAPRDEAALQAFVADRLQAVGLDVDVWEPAVEELDFERYPNPAGYTFAGRPQLLARAAGAGGGRSLLFNGHVDVVNTEPDGPWTSDPFGAAVRQGRLYGRGACDMKAGVAAMIFAVETLRELGVPLLGDVLVNTVTDEEFSGGGSLASVARGARADGALIPEPTSLTAWLGTRGSMLGRVEIDGRAGHAGYPHEHWTAGGPINAIDKARFVLEAFGRLREDWSSHPDAQHHCLFPTSLVPTAITGGQWIVSYPAECSVDFHVQYGPGHADPDGFGTAVESEIRACVAQAAASDRWLAQHPPRVTFSGDSPPSFHEADEPISATLLDAMGAAGLPKEIARRTTFFDGPIFTRSGTPAIAFGPGQIKHAHAVDEFVPLDEVARCAQVLAVAAMRFCSVDE